MLKTQESWSNPQNSDSQIIAVNKKIKNRNIISKDLVEYWRLKEDESETSGFKEDIVISCSMTWRHWKCRDVYIPMNHLYGPTTPTLSESDKKIVLYRAISVTFSKHGTHFGLRPGFSYHIMTSPSKEHHLSASHHMEMC